MKNNVGIVLLNYNTPEDVIKCVESIRDKTKVLYKIYIVDNNSRDNSYEIFKSKFSLDKDILLMKSVANDGFSAGNNLGIKKAIADGHNYICLVNADITLDNDAISILISKMNANNKIGIAAPSILTPNTMEDTQFARNKLTYKNYLGEKTFLKKSKKFVSKYPRMIKESHFQSDFYFYGMTYGCFYIIKSEILERINYLDEDVFLFNEEDILAYKLEELGLKTLITPEARVIHNHHSSISKTSIAFRVFHFRVSALIVLRKYAKVSLFRLFIIITIFKLSWIMKSIVNKNYRKLLTKFFKKLNSIYKLKK